MVRLGDVCDKSSSNIAQKDLESCNGKYPIFGASGLIKNISFYKQEQQYVAIIKDGAGIGRTMLLPAKSSVIGTLQYIIPNTNTNVNYLYYAITNMNLCKYFSGATIPHIYFKDYCKESVPLPSLAEQKQIALVLDKATSLITLRKQQLEKLDLLIKSKFIEMFGDPLTNPMGWDTVKFTDVLVLQRGFDLATNQRDLSGDINVYGSNGILTKHNKSKVTGGGIITGRSGTIGKVNYTFEDFWPLNTTLFSKDLRGNNIIYLAYLLKNFNVERFSAGTGVPTLNRNLIHSEKIYTVTLPLQQQFADFVEHVETLKSTLQKSLALLEMQYKALMQKYFEG